MHAALLCLAALALSLAAAGRGARVGLLAMVCLALTGCSWGKKPSHVPFTMVDYSAELGAQKAKDVTVLTEADKIDAVAPAAAPHTAAQRAAVAAAPAAEVERVVAELRAALKTQGDADARVIADLRAQIEKANSRTDQIIRLGLAAAGAVCIGLGILSAFLAAKVAAMFPGLGPRLSVGIGALGAGFLFCSFAYGWAMRNQTLVMSIAACLCVAVAALFYANRHHAKT
jgi:hypothetical protein